MKLPRQITISGFIIKIVYKKKIVLNGDECFGVYEKTLKTIYIQRGLHPTRKLEIFIHELIHAIADVHRLHLPETKVNTLALALVHVFLDNKIKIFSDAVHKKKKQRKV